MITIVVMRSSLSGMRRLIEAHEKKKSEPVTRRSEGAAIVGSTLIISILSTKK